MFYEEMRMDVSPLPYDRLVKAAYDVKYAVEDVKKMFNEASTYPTGNRVEAAAGAWEKLLAGHYKDWVKHTSLQHPEPKHKVKGLDKIDTSRSSEGGSQQRPAQHRQPAIGRRMNELVSER